MIDDNLYLEEEMDDYDSYQQELELEYEKDNFLDDPEGDYVDQEPDLFFL